MNRSEYCRLMQQAFDGHNITFDVIGLGLKKLRPTALIVSAKGNRAELTDEAGSVYICPLEKISLHQEREAD